MESIPDSKEQITHKPRAAAKPPGKGYRMTFKVREDRNLYDSGKIYTVSVVARKLNGYKVLFPGHDDEVAFIPYSDVEILKLSDEEKTFPIEL